MNWHTCDSEISQGHQTWYEQLDPEHGYNHPKFERPPFDGVRPKANVKVFVKSVNMSFISLEHVEKEK